MTGEEFTEFWQNTYPDTLPISYLFKHVYPDRWVRFHSLPDSKRYPESAVDWNILLHRQNAIIGELVGVETQLLLVTGIYGFNRQTNIETQLAETALHHFVFTPLRLVKLSEVDNELYQHSGLYLPLFTELKWQRNSFDDVLRDIALDNTRAFWVSLQYECLIAPYDGGLDLILKDQLTRDFYKSKYKDWLSSREDGF